MSKFWTIFILAVRNVARNRSRTALTLGAIGFGVLMTLFLGGFAQGFRNLLIDDTINGRTGAMQVHKRGYFDVKDNQPLDFDIEQGGALEQKIRSVSGVTAVTPRLIFSGLVNNGTSSTLFVATGLDPASIMSVMPLMKDDLEGSMVSADKPRGGILGSELALALGTPVGKAVIVQASGKDGKQNALELDVVGALNNGNAFEAKRVGMVPLAYAQELLGMPGRVTEYAIAVTGREVVDDVAARLRVALGDEYEVQTWRELRPNVADVTNFVQVVLTVICLVFLIIAVIGVINTMLMSVLERTREIGTMMAVGVTRAKIMGLFLAEAATLALIGGVGGALIGGGIVQWIAAGGGVVSNPPGSTAIKHIVPATPPELVVIALSASVLGALAAAAYPAWRASRLRPVEALRAV